MSSVPLQDLEGATMICITNCIQGTPASTAAHASMNTFVDALTVPDLVEACCVAMKIDWGKQGGGPGSGLKQLRLISQGVRAAIHSAAQGYKFSLESEAQKYAESGLDDPTKNAFINSLQLLRLELAIPTFISAHIGELKFGTRIFIYAFGICTFKTIHVKLHVLSPRHIYIYTLVPSDQPAVHS